MKKTIFAILIGMFSLQPVVAQQRLNSNLDWRKVAPEKRRELISNLAPEERKQLLRQVRENMLVEDLAIQEKDREKFKSVYNEYQDSQRKIKENFNNNFNADQLTDEQARQKLEESFEVGQKLLDNRRAYAKKMQQVVRPQQVLKMFQNESAMREKMMDRRMESGNADNRQGGGFRTGNPRR